MGNYYRLVLPILRSLPERNSSLLGRGFYLCHNHNDGISRLNARRRAFTMLDDGKITPNFRFDTEGVPLFNAPGNKPDIECEYTRYNMIVEVTLSSGHRQYEMEGEPVARHVGLHQREKGVETYCIFITQKISPATLAHFYILHKTEIAFYRGRAKIIPIEVELFKKLLNLAYSAERKPSSKDMYRFVKQAAKAAQNTHDEHEWYKNVTTLVENWLTTQ